MSTSQSYSAEKLPLHKAHALAFAKSMDERVVLYVTRQAGELLFMDRINSENGPFFPNGVVNKAQGELVEAAALRIGKEEADLTLWDCQHLASFRLEVHDKPQICHYYWCKAPLTTEEVWFWYSERLQAEFDCLFLPLSQYQDCISARFPYALALPEFMAITH